jgi:hypothetical protein
VELRRQKRSSDADVNWWKRQPKQAEPSDRRLSAGREQIEAETAPFDILYRRP